MSDTEQWGKAKVHDLEVPEFVEHDGDGRIAFDCKITYSTGQNHPKYTLPLLYIVDPAIPTVLEQGPGRVYEPGLDSTVWNTGFIPEISDCADSVIVHIDEIAREIEVVSP